MALPGGLEKLLFETVTIKHGWCWRIQDVGHVRVMEYLPRRAPDLGGTSPREASMFTINKDE